MILRFNPWESHHLYWGIIAMGVAYALSPSTPWVCCGSVSFWLYVIGALTALDDLYQHRRQVKEPEYHSPIHKMYGKYIYKLSIIQKLNSIADDLFGGR